MPDFKAITQKQDKTKAYNIKLFLKSKRNQSP